MNPLLSDAARRVVGLRQIVRAAAQGRLERVFIADDVDDKIRAQLEEACAKAGVPTERGATMAQLGTACKIAVGSAAAGILKEAQS